MLSVVLNGNPLDEDNGNLRNEVVLDGICLDELVNDVNLMYLQSVQKVSRKEQRTNRRSRDRMRRVQRRSRILVNINTHSRRMGEM